MDGCWMLQNCVRRLALRDALHTQTLDRRIPDARKTGLGISGACEVATILKQRT